jgi:hypothetical protein
MTPGRLLSYVTGTVVAVGAMRVGTTVGFTSVAASVGAATGTQAVLPRRRIQKTAINRLRCCMRYLLENIQFIHYTPPGSCTFRALPTRPLGTLPKFEIDQFG